MRRTRRIARSLSVVLLLALISPVNFATPAKAAFNFTSLGIFADAVGRANSTVKVTVFSKIPAGVTTVPDQISAEIIGYVYNNYGNTNTSNYSSTSFVTTQTPSNVEGTVATYNLTLTAPTVAGTYYLKYCVSNSTTPYTYATLNSLYTYSDNVTDQCRYSYFQVGGTPSKVFLAHRILNATPITSGTRAEAKTQATLYDSSGFTTLLASGENLTIASTSASMSSSYGTYSSSGTGTVPSTSKMLVFNSSSGDSDGHYRFNLSDLAGETSTVTAFVGMSIAGDPKASMIFATGSFVSSGNNILVKNSNSCSFARASGTDGKLYYWGPVSSPSYYPFSTSLYNKSVNKPQKMDFFTNSSSQTSTKVKKLIDCAYALSDDGRIYSLPNNTRDEISSRQMLAADLQPIESASLSGINVVDATTNLTYLLDSDGKVWKKGLSNFNRTITYSLVDLTSMSSPVIKQIVSQPNLDTLLLLALDGKVYSVGDNTYGILGQGNNLATGNLAQVNFSQGTQVKEVISGYNFFAAVTITNEVWAWGLNSSGEIAKDPTAIQSSNQPILIILPVGVTPGSWNTESGRLGFLNSNGLSFYTTNYSGGWGVVQFASYFSLGTEKVVNFSGYSESGYLGTSMVVLSNNQILQRSGVVGNCISSTGTIRSTGQFGPVSTDDATKYAGIFYSDASGTISTGTSISAKVDTAFSIQVANLQTNCYTIGELNFKWDLTGSGSYSTVASPVLGNTGYLTLSANLNYSSAGRKNVSLQINTPDGVSYYLNFIIGVDPLVSPVVPLSDTATARVMGSSEGALGIGQDGYLYTWGSNYYGQLATSRTVYQYRALPVKVLIPGGALPQSVYLTSNSSFVVDATGKTWAAGYRYNIDGTYSNYETLTAVTYLSSKNVKDIQVGPIGMALQSNGQILAWSFSGTQAFNPAQVVALSGITIKQFTYQYDGSSAYRLIAIDVDGNMWTVPFTSSGAFSDATKVTAFTNVKQLSWNGTQITVVNQDNSVWFSVNASNPFAQVTVPNGVTAVDAMYNGTMYLQDSTNQIWTASASQSGSSVIMSTWTKYAAQVNGQANVSDAPILQHRGSSYISFASGNLMYVNSYFDSGAGRCSIYTASNAGNRVFSTGAFGANNISDSISVNGYIAIAAQNQASFSSGQFFAVNPGDSVVIRMLNPRSGCFSGSQQLEAKADLDSSNLFATSVPLSNEGSGNYAFTFSAIAPTSGIKTISVRITTPIGTSSTFTVGLGVYSSTVLTEVVPRTTPINTSESAVLAVGSDGYAYGWSTPTDVANDYNGSTMSFMNMITNSPPRNSGSPTKVVLPGNPKIREAVPFTSCCTRSSGRYIFGALIVDENGKTYTWGSDASLTAANGYASQSTPTTPTEIPALVGVDVVRLSVSSGGGRALALASNGTVYEWHYSDGSGTSRTQPTKVAGLAGLKIVDIFANDNIYLALTSDGDVYSFYGYATYLGRANSGYRWDFSLTAGKVTIGEQVKALLPVADHNIAMVLTTSNKIYAWGQFYNNYTGNYLALATPTRIELPGNRTPSNAGTVNYDGYSSNVLVASDGTWWNLSGNAQNQIVMYQRTGVPSTVSANLAKFASGNGQAVQLQDGSLWTTNRAIAGTCGPLSTYTKVMSTGQFGAIYKSDQVFIQVSGNEITRPNTPTSVTVTGWSACDGGSNIVFTADLNGSGTYSQPLTGQVSIDGARATATYTFTKTQNGPVYMGFKATSNAGLSGNTTLYTKVVPEPLPGRQIGISINNGARYTNSSNVTLNLVWPDGTTKIYVSNDGGFAPGTVSEYDLQYTIPWVLPPQAVIPLPSIVYARFDNDPTTYYFDDIVLDSIAPVLTFVSSN